VAIGKSVEELLASPEADDNMGSSVEFCGGTHLTNTAEVRQDIHIHYDYMLLRQDIHIHCCYMLLYQCHITASHTEAGS
jgi:hypothetical protein